MSVVIIISISIIMRIETIDEWGIWGMENGHSSVSLKLPFCDGGFSFFEYLDTCTYDTSRRGLGL